jgi:hypothetical protein
MAHSPYAQVVYPPIDDLSEYQQQLVLLRSEWDVGKLDKCAPQVLLDFGDTLLEQCKFLEGKISVLVI